MRTYLEARVEAQRNGERLGNIQLIDVSTVPHQAWNILAYNVRHMQLAMLKGGCNVADLCWTFRTSLR